VKPELVADRAGNFQIWDYPIEGREYVCGIDVAEGRKKDRTAMDRKRQHSYADGRPDYSCCVVIERDNGMHVATWHGYLTPDEFTTCCVAVGLYYNTALLVPEINGPGIVVVTRLSETFRYPNIYRTRLFNVMGRDPFAAQLGWRTDNHTRKMLVSNVHDALNTSLAFTRDKRLLSELRTMEFDDQGTERARGNDKDDLVMAYGLALQGRNDSLSQLVDEKKTSSGRSYDDFVWNKVREKLESRDARRSADRRVFLGRSGSVLPRGSG
jgi:hypothetical protein